jgi:hypothetical protein
MTVELIRGPMEAPPPWSPSVVTFVRNKMGLRELGEPLVHGSFAEQVAAWFKERTMGGKPQYWQVDITERRHPEVQLELLGKGSILKFDIRLNFNVRVVDAKLVLEENIRSVDGYFTPALRGVIAPIAHLYDMSQSAELQEDILRHLGGRNRFSNGRVEVAHLAVQVQPADPDALGFMKKKGLVPTQREAIEAEFDITEAEMTAYKRRVGGMTIDALAQAAIATGNPRLIEAYKNLRQLHIEEDERNWKRLEFLVQNKLVEPHDLEKHLGPLGDDVVKRLIGTAGQGGVPKMISKS